MEPVLQKLLDRVRALDPEVNSHAALEEDIVGIDRRIAEIGKRVAEYESREKGN